MRIDFPFIISLCRFSHISCHSSHITVLIRSAVEGRKGWQATQGDELRPARAGSWEDARFERQGFGQDYGCHSFSQMFSVGL